MVLCKTESSIETAGKVTARQDPAAHGFQGIKPFGKPFPLNRESRRGPAGKKLPTEELS